jgi:hypothetical protein
MSVSNSLSSLSANGTDKVSGALPDDLKQLSPQPHLKGQPIIQKIKKLQAEGKVFYSFEYFPPKTREGVENLYERLDRMSSLEPLFMDLTWCGHSINSTLKSQ